MENEHVFSVTTRLDILDNDPPVITGDDSDLKQWECPPFRLIWHPLKVNNLLYDLEQRDIEKAKLLKCNPHLLQLILDHLEYLFPTSLHHPDDELKIFATESANAKVVDKLYSLLSSSIDLKSLVAPHLNLDHLPPDTTDLFTHRDASENLLKEIIHYWIQRRQEVPAHPPQKTSKKTQEKCVAQYPLIAKNRFRKTKLNDYYDVFHFSEEHEFNTAKIRKLLRQNIDEVNSDLKFAIQMGNSFLVREYLLYYKILKEQDDPSIPDFLKLFPQEKVKIENIVKPKAYKNPYSDGMLDVIDQDNDEKVTFDIFGNVQNQK